MKIHAVEVAGLMGRDGSISFDLHDDLNITTGLNGSGKTTLLKLIWYIISGNVEHALSEIPFKKIIIHTDAYSVYLNKLSDNTCDGAFSYNGDTEQIEDIYGYDEDGDGIVEKDARDIFNERISSHGSSLFFPTFRRIEGGFTIQSSSSSSRNFLFNSARSTKNEMQEAVLTISRRLSSGAHTFITSISTIDVAELLLKKYTELSEMANSLQQKTSQEVINRIKLFKKEAVGDGSAENSHTADHVLDDIRSTIEKMDETRGKIMSPLDAVQKMVVDLFQHSGIKIGSRFNFGDAANAVSSDSLSAGEKQMLSFICYNALTENSVVFIDEPELSLHVDWQRQLFPKLLSQGTSNQFIIATHSPFIYSKYPDKEIMLSQDRGNSKDVDVEIDL